MMKTGVAAILAIATMSASVAAQDATATTAACAPLWAHCAGPEPGDDATCCRGTQCVQKNKDYSQCRPVGEIAPAGWIGSIITSKTITDVPDADAAEEYDEPPAEDDLIMDAEDMVQMGMVPAGMDAEDLEEMGFEPGMDEEDLVELGIIPGEDADATEDGGDDEVADYGEQVSEDMTEIAGEEAIAPQSDIGDLVVYKAVIGKDYSPSSNGSPRLVDVTDLGNSYEVADPSECEDLCTITPDCNAASYYLDGTPYGGPNCWLKTLADSCDMPSDADDDPNAVFLLQLDPTCDTFEDQVDSAFGPASAPLGVEDSAEAPVLAPIGNTTVSALPGNTSDPLVAGGTTRSLNDPSTVSTADPSGAVSVQGALIAMAVAGAAAFF